MQHMINKASYFKPPLNATSNGAHQPLQALPGKLRLVLPFMTSLSLSQNLLALEFSPGTDKPLAFDALKGPLSSVLVGNVYPTALNDEQAGTSSIDEDTLNLYKSALNTDSIIFDPNYKGLFFKARHQKTKQWSFFEGRQVLKTLTGLLQNHRFDKP